MLRRLAIAALALAVALASSSAIAAEPQAKPRPAAPRKPLPPKPAPAAPAPPPVAETKPEPPPPPGVRMTTAYTQGAQISQNSTFLQGARQRVEFPGLVTLDQCDLRRSVILNTSARRYRVQPYPEAATATPAAAPEPMDLQAAQMAQLTGGPPKPPAPGGVVTLTTTHSDTLERQTMFGFEARRIKTLVIKQSTGTACDKSPLKVEIDAWYVDLPAQAGCTRPASPAPAPVADPNACTDRIETRVAGDVKLGFPIKTATVTTIGEGDKLETTTSGQEVTALEVTPLDRALFEVPKDFVEAHSTAEVVPALAAGGSLADALFGSTADGTSAATPKKPGAVRIGILEPINKTARDLQTASLRRDLVGKFNKAPYEAIPLAGSAVAEIEQNAARLQCDYLLLAEVVEAKTSKPGKMSGLSRLTGGGPPKDSHDVKVDYKLFALGATQAPKLSGNAKASNGGFGVGSALRLASFAGQMYMSMMMGGMGMGMMNPMMMSGMGGLSPMGGGLFDPRASAMTSMFSSLGGGAMAGMTGMAGMGGMPGMADPSESAMRDTVSEALGNGAKAVMEQLGKKK